jgi:uncharacterized damage-inducible protein DinB
VNAKGRTEGRGHSVSGIELLARQVAAGYREGGWPGVSVRELLRDLSAAEAAAHPIPGAHSAWEIALHLTCWHRAVRRRLAGDATEVTSEQDWPEPARATARNWRSAVAALDRAHAALVRAVRVLPPEKLAERVPRRQFTVQFMLHGVPQHDLYHGGQVMMLKKALRRRPGRKP